MSSMVIDVCGCLSQCLPSTLGISTVDTVYNICHVHTVEDT